MASFNASNISGPINIPGTANFYFVVTLPDGTEGHVVVGPGDAMAETDEQVRHERVAAALNFQTEGSSYNAVVNALRASDGLRINLVGF